MLDLIAFRPKIESFLHDALLAFATQNPSERIPFLVLGIVPIEGILQLGRCTNAVPSDPDFKFYECIYSELAWIGFTEWHDEAWGDEEPTIRADGVQIQPKKDGGGDSEYNQVFGPFFSKLLHEFFDAATLPARPDWMGIAIHGDYYDYWQPRKQTE